MELAIMFLLGFLLGILSHFMINIGKYKYLNSNVQNETPVEFEVVGIEKACGTKSLDMAVYTILNCYFSKENNKGFIYRHYKIYDVRNKYKIGDRLTLKAYEKE